MQHSELYSLTIYRLLKIMFYFLQAHKTMAEIPEQFMSYMEDKNIVPNLPVERPVQETSSITPQAMTIRGRSRIF